MAGFDILSRFGLLFLLWNCRSIKANSMEFNNFVNKVNPHFICLCETYLNLTDNLKLTGYRIFRKDRLGKAGGVAIIVRNDIKSRTMQNFTNYIDGNLEAMAIQIMVNSIWCDI